MKLFQVTIPNDQHHKVVTVLQDDLNLENVTSIEARTSSIKLGVGVQFGFCDVMSPTTAGSKNSMRSRRGIFQKASDVPAIPVAEIYAHIEASTTLSRDSIGMLFISSYGFHSWHGLAGDSPTCVVASMLLSPLMVGPILGCSFGYTIRDRNKVSERPLQRTLCIGCAITFLLGRLVGIVLVPYADDVKWPTVEMSSRGQAVSLIFGAMVAALSGAGVALAESNANISSVVPHRQL
ncbi:hypothetical protein H257_03869 [Aphanomyces astaci]|uniref:Uncharacterized protein n=1 Tax=Aphanomyces astaci TaxID=112090 RepID=W4GYM8_APHAT|nr:hypothetical protein H257_03869 [Aphanomyces astaci]ETV84772.1 hypothetical protein H257_03869 [Aphanomyces astaci]|eukprot:XP_009826464.1 hypothetical protein H257_03869 [Aphanomyces astaci]